MNVTEFKEKFFDDEGVFNEWEFRDDEFELVEEGPVESDGKYTIQQIVYLHLKSNKYFEVTLHASNGGYWGDCESYPSHVSEVEPIIIKKNSWRKVENN